MQPLTQQVVHSVECIVPAQFAAGRAAGLGCRTLSRPRWSSCWNDLLSRVAAQCLLHEHHACTCACPSPGPLLNSRKSRPCSRRHKTARRAQPRWRTGPTGGRSMPAVQRSRIITIPLTYHLVLSRQNSGVPGIISQGESCIHARPHEPLLKTLICVSSFEMSGANLKFP